MKAIKFNKDYAKLDNRIFTTIRNKNKNINFGEIVEVTQPKGSFKAVCYGHEYIHFKNIPNPILWRDLDSLPTYNVFPEDNYPPEEEQALNLIKKIYPDLTLDSKVYVYTFERWELTNDYSTNP